MLNGLGGRVIGVFSCASDKRGVLFLEWWRNSSDKVNTCGDYKSIK